MAEDLVGSDICLEILGVLNADLCEKYRPCPLLMTMLAARELVGKSREVFYECR